MITLEKTSDAALIDAVLSDPSVEPWVTCDVAKKVTFDSLKDFGVTFYGVKIDGANAGLFALSRTQCLNNESRLHCCLLSTCRGKLALEAGRKMLKEIEARGRFYSVISIIPRTHKHVKHFLARLGFVPCQRIPNAHMKNGKQFDATVYRKDLECH